MPAAGEPCFAVLATDRLDLTGQVLFVDAVHEVLAGFEVDRKEINSHHQATHRPGSEQKSTRSWMPPAGGASMRPPECPRPRPCGDATGIADALRLLDHLVGSGQQRFRDGEAEGFGGLEVDDKLGPRRLLNREVRRLLAL